jgi:hypothetical protein
VSELCADLLFGVRLGGLRERALPDDDDDSLLFAYQGRRSCLESLNGLTPGRSPWLWRRTTVIKLVVAFAVAAEVEEMMTTD